MPVSTFEVVFVESLRERVAVCSLTHSFCAIRCSHTGGGVKKQNEQRRGRKGVDTRSQGEQEGAKRGKGEHTPNGRGIRVCLDRL
jgi:hypothetical protein